MALSNSNSKNKTNKTSSSNKTNNLISPLKLNPTPIKTTQQSNTPKPIPTPVKTSSRPVRTNNNTSVVKLEQVINKPKSNQSKNEEKIKSNLQDVLERNLKELQKQQIDADKVKQAKIQHLRKQQRSLLLPYTQRQANRLDQPLDVIKNDSSNKTALPPFKNKNYEPKKFVFKRKVNTDGSLSEIKRADPRLFIPASNDLSLPLTYQNTKNKKGITSLRKVDNKRNIVEAIDPKNTTLEQAIEKSKFTRRQVLSTARKKAIKGAQIAAGTGAAAVATQATMGKKIATGVGGLWQRRGKKVKDNFIRVMDTEAALKKVYNQASDLEKNIDVVENLGKKKMSRRDILAIPKLFATNAKNKLDRKAEQATGQVIKDSILPPADMTNKTRAYYKQFSKDNTPIRYKGRIIAHVPNPIEKLKTMVANVTGSPGQVLLGRTPLQQRKAFKTTYAKELAKRVSAYRTARNAAVAGAGTIIYKGQKAKADELMKVPKPVGENPVKKFIATKKAEIKANPKQFFYDVAKQIYRRIKPK